MLRTIGMILEVSSLREVSRRKMNASNQCEEYEGDSDPDETSPASPEVAGTSPASPDGAGTSPTSPERARTTSPVRTTSPEGARTTSPEGARTTSPEIANPQGAQLIRARRLNPRYF